MGTATGTRLSRKDRAYIPGAIPDDRQGLPFQSGFHQLSFPAIRKEFLGNWVYHLDQIVVLPDVDAALMGTVDPHAHAAGLGHSDNIKSFDARAFFYLSSQFIAPHFRPEDAYLKLGLAEVKPFFFCHLH